jgi:hypothetical protein
MDVRVEDVCVVTGYRLTEYQVFDDNELVNTYFSIRNDKGAVLGSNYDDIEKPLDIILSIEYQDLSYILPNEIA